ncbi:amidohydrolase [Virgibacillus halodenitrificans]|uniref:Amidohydrolase n=1 Tax=Virgibacillus halodenitrificans TaxID=1482 RepID=A0ABR7VH52_VIRHA|nr:amidohydrolase [Virgibacillus halodenitrificans]MBD1221278.1 amidohydrolase [Virgibacillus halodenitrificans]
MVAKQTSNTIFINGQVITMNKEHEEASTIVVKNGTIVAVGQHDLIELWQEKDTKIVDLQRKTIMPSFIESHVHPVIYAKNIIQVDCSPRAVSTVSDILIKVKQEAASVKEGQWIRGYGWNDSQIEEGRAPTRKELDEVAPNNPVILKRTCNHVAVVNTKALELSDINEKTPNPQGGEFIKDSNGEMNGIVQEQALNLINPPPYSEEELTKGFNIAQENFLKWGITTVHEMAGTTEEMSLYQKLHHEKNLRIRVRPWLLALDIAGMKGMLSSVLNVGLRSNFGDDYLTIQGVKFLLDGAGSGGTARVYEPNVSNGKRGIIYYDIDQYAPYVEQSIKAGLRTAVHAIGDEAIELALKGYERVGESVDITNMRNRIEHCGLPTEEQLKRMKKLELVAASSVGFIYHVGDNYLYHYGKERMKRLYPHKSFKDYGIIAPANSDLPVVSGNPFQGMYGAVTRKTHQGTILDDEQGISVFDALKAYTVDAAYSSFEEDKLGVIKKGAKADLIVISDNPLKVDVETLKDIYVEQTYVDGLLVWDKE